MIKLDRTSRIILAGLLPTISLLILWVAMDGPTWLIATLAVFAAIEVLALGLKFANRSEPQTA